MHAEERTSETLVSMLPAARIKEPTAAEVTAPGRLRQALLMGYR